VGLAAQLGEAIEQGKLPALSSLALDCWCGINSEDVHALVDGLGAYGRLRQLDLGWGALSNTDTPYLASAIKSQ
jgi:hypothetical protein